ncbi:hypothetical protein [Cereibacter johrii]|uniref:hypothetical protein n=1 Tax=Cereibacter johrii TaxID=445629 RepID=UPI0011BE084C|nr:hypothetical protein [Cereibacter johrii]
MRIRIMALSVCVIAFYGPSLADDLTMSVGSPDQQTIYLSGAATALAVANLQMPEEERIFCAPPDYSLSPQELRDLAAIDLVGAHEPSTVLVAAVHQLRERFPCQ